MRDWRLEERVKSKKEIVSEKVVGGFWGQNSNKSDGQSSGSSCQATQSDATSIKS